jgi:hypothetical protein
MTGGPAPAGGRAGGAPGGPAGRDRAAPPWGPYRPPRWPPGSGRPGMRPGGTRRARPRICLRNGGGRKYQPRVWNQRHCQEPECRCLVRRWQAVRRQARRRRDSQITIRHAQAERARRERAKIVPQTDSGPPLASPRGHAADDFFPSPMRPAGLSRIACNLTPQPRALLWPRLPEGGSKGVRSQMQVALARHLGWSEEACF